MEHVYKNSIVTTICIIITLFFTHKPIYSQAQPPQSKCVLYTFLTTLKNAMVIHDHPAKDNKDIASAIAHLPSYVCDTLKSYGLRSIDVPRDLWQAFMQVCTSLDGCTEFGAKEVVLLHSRVQSLQNVLDTHIKSEGLAKVGLQYGDIYSFTYAMSKVLAHEECADLFLLAGRALRKKLSNEPLITVKQGLALATLAGIAGFGWYLRGELKHFANYTRLYPAYRSGDLSLEKPSDTDAVDGKSKDDAKPKQPPLIDVLTITYIKKLPKEWFINTQIPEPVKVKALAGSLATVKPADLKALIASGKDIQVLPVILKALCKQYVHIHLKAEKQTILEDLKSFSPAAQEQIKKDYFYCSNDQLDNEQPTFYFQDHLDAAFWNQGIDQNKLLKAYPILNKLGGLLVWLREHQFEFTERVKVAEHLAPHYLDIEPSIMGDVLYTAYAINSPNPIKEAFINRYAEFCIKGDITPGFAQEASPGRQEQFDKDFGKDQQEIRDAIGRHYFKQTGKFLQNAGRYSLKELMTGNIRVDIATIKSHPVMDIKGLPLNNLEGLETVTGIGNKPYLIIINSGVTEIPPQTQEKLKKTHILFMTHEMVQTLDEKCTFIPAELTKISPVLDDRAKSELTRKSNAKPYVAVKWEGNDYQHLQKAVPTLNEIAYYLKGTPLGLSEQTLIEITKGIRLQQGQAAEVLYVADKLKLHDSILKVLAENYAMLMLCGKVNREGVYTIIGSHTKQLVTTAYDNSGTMSIIKYRK